MKKVNLLEKMAKPKNKPKQGSYQAIVAAALWAEKKGIKFQLTENYEKTLARHKRAH